MKKIKTCHGYSLTSVSLPYRILPFWTQFSCDLILNQQQKQYFTEVFQVVSPSQGAKVVLVIVQLLLGEARLVNLQLTLLKFCQLWQLFQLLEHLGYRGLNNTSKLFLTAPITKFLHSEGGNFCVRSALEMEKEKNTLGRLGVCILK